MTAIGADPQALDTLAGEFRRAAAAIDRMVDDIARVTRRARWEGPDALRFEREWHGHRARLGACSSACRTLAVQLTAQAAGQRRASAPGVAASTGSARSSSIGPLPRSVDVYSGNLQASLGPIGGSITGTIALEDLGRGRVRVSHTDQVGAGLDVGVGSSVGLITGDRAESTGSSAGLSAMVDGRTTRQWTVDDAHVPALLAGLAVETGPIGMPFRATDSFVQGVDDALSWFGVDTGLGEQTSFPLLPDPDRVEHLVGITGSVTGTGTTAAALGGTGALAGAVLVGSSSQGSRHDLVVEAQGSSGLQLSRALHRALGIDGAPGMAAGSVRIETPAPGDAGVGRRPTLITLTSTTEHDQVMLRVAVDPTLAGPAGSSLIGAGRTLATGDTNGAATALARLRLPAEAIETHVATGSVSRSNLAVPVQGPAASITQSGAHVTVTYR